MAESQRGKGMQHRQLVKRRPDAKEEDVWMIVHVDEKNALDRVETALLLVHSLPVSWIREKESEEGEEGEEDRHPFKTLSDALVLLDP